MSASRFDIFQDVNGQHYVLLEPQRVSGVWLAFIIESASICYRATWNLERMKKVGHAGIEGRNVSKSPLACVT